ncbi:MAG TPA: serine hydrolase [Puia sp.]|nr:serine hydrolase [Puia sp.]
MVRQNRLDIHTPVPIEAWQKDDRRTIAYANLMQMTSGLRFQWVPIAPSDLTNMLFKEKDMATLVEGLPLEHPPGTVFHYSDGKVNATGRAIRPAGHGPWTRAASEHPALPPAQSLPLMDKKVRPVL